MKWIIKTLCLIRIKVATEMGQSIPKVTPDNFISLRYINALKISYYSWNVTATTCCSVA